MDTIHVNQYMKSYPQYKGTFPLDHIPETHARPCSMIINTDPCTEPGTHWVAIYLNVDGTGEYFDSFGLPPLHKTIINYLNWACPMGYTHNRTTLQDLNAKTCGLYCILYLKLRHKGYRSVDILGLFCSNTIRNEQEILKWNIKTL